VSASVAAALEEGRARLAAAGIGPADLEARVLLGHATGLGPAALIACGGEPLGTAAAGRYDELLRERSRRVPLAYLTGEREFWSLRLLVDRRVLVPRPETETLVEAALERLRPAARIADIGTGSGAVVIALAKELGDGEFFAVDRSVDALEVAQANAAAHGFAGRIRFLEGDLLAPLAGRGVTLEAIVANLPYVPAGELCELQPEVRDHEPRLALDGGPDGLAVIERIVAGAPPLLRPGGWLLLEVGAGQAPRVRELLERAGGYGQTATRRDLAGIERVVAARRAA
jgi:release factor glutamine methyltransferase